MRYDRSLSLNSVVTGFLLSVLFLAVVSCSARIDVANPSNSKTQKAVVCHKGKKTLTVGQSALKAHLKHGDHLGSCGRY